MVPANGRAGRFPGRARAPRLSRFPREALGMRLAEVARVQAAISAASPLAPSPCERTRAQRGAVVARRRVVHGVRRRPHRAPQLRRSPARTRGFAGGLRPRAGRGGRRDRGRAERQPAGAGSAPRPPLDVRSLERNGDLVVLTGERDASPRAAHDHRIASCHVAALDQALAQGRSHRGAARASRRLSSGCPRAVAEAGFARVRRRRRGPLRHRRRRQRLCASAIATSGRSGAW